MKNYRPVSLLPICAKIFQRIVYNRISEYLLKNNRITGNQSAFKPLGSSINQLLKISRWQLQGKRCVPWYLQSVWQSLAWWLNLQGKTKWNIRKKLKITKDFWDTRKKVGKYYTRGSSRLDYIVLVCSYFVKDLSKIYHQTPSYLLMVGLLFLLFIF